MMTKKQWDKEERELKKGEKRKKDFDKLIESAKVVNKNELTEEDYNIERMAYLQNEIKEITDEARCFRAEGKINLCMYALTLTRRLKELYNKMEW